jgi:UDP-N-acetylglucosamine--N-acetylmuramyl-(pentapeptide) pyrophosphoryl-undecaprenol N-acetylglucosamine transferase
MFIAGPEYKNAMALVSKGAALLVENDKTVDELPAAVIKLNNDKELQKSLSQNIKHFAKPDATERITDEIFKLLK